MKLLPLFLTTVLIIYSVDATIQVDLSTSNFVDDFKRTRIFHGMNAVYKEAPWHPAVSGYDSENTLSPEDSVNLRSWGFNIVRLGVMWPGVEPAGRGQYNQTYLDQIETIVMNLAAENIYVILDLHQDIWHRKFCGEGVPDYVYETCVKAEPTGTKPFPLPAVNETYPVDENGNPTLESCLSKGFATYYLSAEVGAGFQCLYDNVDNLWDAFAGYWVTVATRFSGFSNVLGYELINEPWAGDVFASPKNLLPGYAEKTFLQPLYEYVHKAIRAVDDKKIIFFEGLTIDYWQDGFTQGPGGSSYNDRQMFAYHMYCPVSDPTVKSEAACDAINQEFFHMRRKDAERMGVGMIMTEFGAAEDIKGDVYALGWTTDLLDENHQSWMYWQFKYYQDITTCTPQGESMYNADGSVCEHKLRVLSRTYPQAVAGQLGTYKYNSVTGKFNMEMNPLTSSSFSSTASSMSRTTEIYVNIAQNYPLGFNVNLSGATQARVTVVCPARSMQQPHLTGGIIELIQSNAGSDIVDENLLSVEVTQCGPKDSSCTCRYL